MKSYHNSGQIFLYINILSCHNLFIKDTGLYFNELIFEFYEPGSKDHYFLFKSANKFPDILR